MGLDLYAGPIWRLYAGDLERPLQRFMREAGIEVRIDYAPGATPLTQKKSVQLVDKLRRAIDAEARRRAPEAAQSLFGEIRPNMSLADRQLWSGSDMRVMLTVVA
jgi:hypothetical protein